MSAVLGGEVHPSRDTKHPGEIQAGPPHRRRVYYRSHLGKVVHQDAVEQLHDATRSKGGASGLGGTKARGRGGVADTAPSYIPRATRAFCILSLYVHTCFTQRRCGAGRYVARCPRPRHVVTSLFLLAIRQWYRGKDGKGNARGNPSARCCRQKRRQVWY